MSERELGQIQQKMKDLENTVNNGFADIKQDLSDIRKELRDGYVTRHEFEPIRSLVYGAAAVLLTAILTALVYLVVQH